ncbi:MAG: PLDc N-terminal domain-containing protein [Planctomycetota bacterium]|nr:PLDc N-terminal domain-containing protein [Planctomycetota bacterium]
MGYSLVGALVLALDLIAIASLLMGRASVAHKLLWIVLILCLPVLGMILYFLLGRSPADA